MTMTKVHSVVSIKKFILIIFSTVARCWQFRVIGSGGVVFGESKIYYTAQAAQRAIPGMDSLGELRVWGGDRPL